MATTDQMVSFSSGSAHLEGYLARPEGEGPFPAIVVIHEIFGLNENIKDITQRFAKQGYVALGVDMFSKGNKVLCMFRAMGDMLFRAPDKNGGVRDLKAALTFLTDQPGVDSKRLGAVGYCMGGGYAIAWACADERLKVIAPYYGVNPRPFNAVIRACPVVGSYPGKDFTTKAGQKLDQALTEYKIDHDIKIYPDARHSFFNDKGPAYNEAAAKDSWQRTLKFFEEHLPA